MSYKTLAPNYITRFRRVIANLGSGDKILNLGCGDGYYDPFLLKKFKNVVGLDVNKDDLTIAKNNNRSKNISYFLGDGEKLSFKSSSFDAVICVDVLEHVKFDDKIIKEISRVLKNKGTLIVTVPNSQFPFTYDPINAFLGLFKVHIPIGLWGFGHFRLYSSGGLSKKLADNGLKPIKIEHMLHSFCGLFENYYLVNLFQIFTKSDPRNQTEKNKFMVKSLLNKQPPKLLAGIRDLIIDVDSWLFKNRKTSLGILIKARKMH